MRPGSGLRVPGPEKAQEADPHGNQRHRLVLPGVVLRAWVGSDHGGGGAPRPGLFHRVAPGEAVEVLNLDGLVGVGTLTRWEGRSCWVDVQEVARERGERPAPLVLGLAVLHTQAFDWAVEKATELGGTAVVPSDWPARAGREARRAGASLAPHRRRAQERQAHLRREAKEKAGAEDLAKMMSGLSVTIAQKAGELDQLFGSVTAKDIAEALEKQNYHIDRRKIHLPDPIKQLGEHKVTIRLHREVPLEVTVQVVKED